MASKGFDYMTHTASASSSASSASASSTHTATSAEALSSEALAESFSAAAQTTIDEVFAAKEAELAAAAQAIHQATSEDAEKTALLAENKELKDQLLRAFAETDNLRKRTERDLQDARKYAVTGFARDLVNVLENLQLALLNIPAEARENDEKLATLAEGVEMTANELLRVFQNQGIIRIAPVGEKFDHNFHQAVAQVESGDAEAGTIIQVLQAGYVIHDRLLRPAMVTVAKASNQGGVRVDTQA
jgi:molecular chaperone GrpE